MLMNTRAGADAPEAARVREDLARAGRGGRLGRAGGRRHAPEALRRGDAGPAGRHDRPGARADGPGPRPAAVAGTLRGMARRPDRTGDLVRIAVPTLVLAGADDRLIPLEESRRMAEAIPQAQLVVIPDAGHLAPLENPEASNAAILRFLDALA